MGDASIEPKPGITTTANPASGQQSQFALFSDSWLEMQGYVGAAIALPISSGNFEEKYGSLGASKTITDCIEAMRGVQATATEFGDPKSLRKALIANPNLLASSTAPKEIYTHTVWLGQRVHETAGKLVSGYQSVLDELPSLPSAEKVQAIKDYLFDATLGPIPLAKTMSDECGVLIIKLGKFEQKMNEFNEKFRAFTSKSSDMMAEITTAIGGLETRIAELEKSRDEAYSAWRDFTIAASVTAVGCFLIGACLAPFTAGVSLLVGTVAGLATGIGLGVKAAQLRGKYNEYCSQIESQGEDLKKKQRLRSDLGDFNTQMDRVGPAMAKFVKSLQLVQGVWVSMNTDMLAIHNSITESNVGTVPFLVKAKATSAIDAWKAVDESAKQFTVGSLIDYRSVAFGDKMPESMPNAA